MFIFKVLLFHTILSMVEIIGTKVSIPGTSGYGVLKYIGEIDGKAGVFCGIELIGPIALSRGKNSGIINGIKYFDVRQPMTGLFLPLDRLRSVNSQLDNLLPERAKRTNTSSRPASRTGHVLSPTKSTKPTSRNTTPRVLSPININQVSYLPKTADGNSEASSLDILNQIEKVDLSANEVSLEELDNLEQLFQDNKILKEELASFKLSNQQYQIELSKKDVVSENLKTTINDLHLLLEKYEKGITEKDKRLDRIRSDFEHSREEWRKSLDLLVSTQQENDMVYERTIEDLNAEIDELKGNVNSAQGSTVLKSKVKKDFGQQKQNTLERSGEVFELRNQLSQRQGLLEGLELEANDLRLEIQYLKDTLRLKDNIIEELRKSNENELTLSRNLSNGRQVENSTLNMGALSQINTEMHPFSKENKSPPSPLSWSNAKKLDTENYENEGASSKLPKQLPIYVPPQPADPSEGREGWCGLCERGGHSSINCPFENDIF